MVMFLQNKYINIKKMAHFFLNNFLSGVCIFLLLVFVHNGMMQTMIPKS